MAVVSADVSMCSDTDGLHMPMRDPQAWDAYAGLWEEGHRDWQGSGWGEPPKSSFNWNSDAEGDILVDDGSDTLPMATDVSPFKDDWCLDAAAIAAFRTQDDARFRQVLQYAIMSCPEDHLRSFLARLVNEEDTKMGDALGSLLLTFKNRPGYSFAESDFDISEVVPRWETCRNCRVTYDAASVSFFGECRYHKGELHPNRRDQEEWDTSSRGPMNTEDNKKEWAENFTWSCCDVPGNVPFSGCVTDKHQPTALMGTGPWPEQPWGVVE